MLRTRSMLDLPMRRRRSNGRRGYALLDAILGGMLLAIALTAVLSLAARSMQMERNGEEEVVAAALLDEALTMVLVEGPTEFSKLHDTSGYCEPPFDDWTYEVVIEAQGIGDPWEVNASVKSPRGDVYRCDTLMAPRSDGADVIVRRPPLRIDREERYEAQREAAR